MAATLYSLKAELREFLKDKKYSDPREAAEDFFPTIPPEEYGQCLRELLPQAVGDVIRSGHNSTKTTKRDELSMTGRSLSKDKETNKYERPPAKWEVAKKKLMDEQYSVGDRNYRRLGDCNLADLDQIIARYEQLTADMANKTERFKALRKEFIKRKLKRIDEFPAQVALEIMSD